MSDEQPVEEEDDEALIRDIRSREGKYAHDDDPRTGDESSADPSSIHRELR